MNLPSYVYIAREKDGEYGPGRFYVHEDGENAFTDGSFRTGGAVVYGVYRLVRTVKLTATIREEEYVPDSTDAEGPEGSGDGG
jgi:hypothetical protein